MADPFRLPASGAFPWTGADYAYAGWVPNVSGHLSFNLIDPQSKHPTFNHQPRLDCPRLVAAHRARLAQDYPFFDWLVKLFRRSARQDFILVAQSVRVVTPFFLGDSLEHSDDANGALSGLVAVIPTDAAWSTCWRIRRTLKAIDRQISDAVADKADGAPDPGQGLPADILAELGHIRGSIACYFLRFALFRTGELRIWFDLADFLGRDIVAEPPTPRELVAADHLAPQAYYFIKDLVHAHYHHIADSDQLLPLTETPRPADAAAHQDNEVGWRYATLRGLARVVVELRQGRSIAGHQQAKGVIAYAQAFQTVLARITRGREAQIKHKICDEIIPYDFSNLTMSLDATDASAQSVMSARLQLFAIVVGIVLSGLALWAGAVQIQPILCTSLDAVASCPKIEPGPVVSIVNDIVANPSAFLIVLFALGMVPFILFFRGLNAIPWAERGIRWLRRLTEAVGAQVSRWLRGNDIVGWLVSLAMLGGLTLYVAHLAIKAAPTTLVPPVAVDDPETRRGPWAPLYPLVGKRVDQSGLLVRSVIAGDLRTLLADDYAPFLKAFGPEATLVREGALLVLTSAPTGGDAAYLMIAPQGLRIEAGVRRDGMLRVHRSQGARLPRPRAVIDLLGATGQSDAGPIPIEASKCESALGGTSGRVIHLSGTLRAKDFCEYAVELQKGQALTFDRKRSQGLNVLVIEGRATQPLDQLFIAQRTGKQVIHVVPEGWRPKPGETLKPRAFYVRLDIH